jgi:DNA helicase-2/ATP-dependent DNA helicase PcrA
LDLVVNAGGPLLILTGQKRMVDALHPFWGRRIPIWEGYTRDALADLVVEVTSKSGDTIAISQAVSAFLLSVATGFTAKGHAKVFLREVESKCAASTRGVPARLQGMARFILEEPNHIGVSKGLSHIAKLKADGIAGFSGIQFNHPGALKDAIRLGDFEDANEGMKQIHHRRSFARPVPQPRAISTIHKAKGLECENAIVIPCDQQQFSATDYARCKLYVALSRAKQTLHLVVSRDNPSPLMRLP